MIKNLLYKDYQFEGSESRTLFNLRLILVTFLEVSTLEDGRSCKWEEETDDDETDEFLNSALGMLLSEFVLLMSLILFLLPTLLTLLLLTGIKRPVSLATPESLLLLP